LRILYKNKYIWKVRMASEPFFLFLQKIKKA
jgi:hypothetical protein